MKTKGAEWAISIVAGIMLFAMLCFGLTSFSPTNAVKGLAKSKDSHHAANRCRPPGIGWTARTSWRPGQAFCH